MSDINQIWLAPICHEDGDGRLWCQDDVWGDDCGCGIAQHSAVRYVIASDYDRFEQECERLRHSASSALLERLVAELLDSGAQNYQESVFDLDLGSELLTASVVLRYRDKPSAHELRVLAEAERDALRAQVEAMRALLVDAHWTVHLPTTEHAIIPRCRCRKCVISRIDAALQAKP